jgi:hypothetical protein
VFGWLSFRKWSEGNQMLDARIAYSSIAIASPVSPPEPRSGENRDNSGPRQDRRIKLC